mmetsp:Transcript_75306/g.232919  ORF Transcript_75306/g.232919 Transcript_75306/m.232919 type:complete len:243 (+) Transcript_75306:727-1455(+)
MDCALDGATNVDGLVDNVGDQGGGLVDDAGDHVGVIDCALDYVIDVVGLIEDVGDRGADSRRVLNVAHGAGELDGEQLVRHHQGPVEDARGDGHENAYRPKRAAARGVSKAPVLQAAAGAWWRLHQGLLCIATAQHQPLQSLRRACLCDAAHDGPSHKACQAKAAAPHVLHGLLEDDDAPEVRGKHAGARQDRRHRRHARPARRKVGESRCARQQDAAHEAAKHLRCGEHPRELAEDAHHDD